MLQAALSVIDERRIASVFGRKQMKPRLAKEDMTKLHPEVIQEFDSGHLSKACVEEIKNVVPKRQKEILTEIRKTGNGTSNFVKSQVLQTPKPERTTDSKKISPWSKREKEKKSMVDKLKNVSKECDFFVSTYRRNVSDLTRTVIYVREMISIKKIEQFLKVRLQYFKKRHDILLLPVFRQDEPMIMTSGRKTREWIHLIHRVFPSLFHVNGNYPHWLGEHPKDQLPKLSCIAAYIQKNGDVVRIVKLGEEIVKIILWTPQEKESHEIE